jgi:hypothetical protein
MPVTFSPSCKCEPSGANVVEGGLVEPGGKDIKFSGGFELKPRAV